MLCKSGLVGVVDPDVCLIGLARGAFAALHEVVGVHVCSFFQVFFLILEQVGYVS